MADIHSCGYLLARLGICREDSAKKTVLTIVGNCDSLFEVLEFKHRQNRPEDLLLSDSHVRGDVDEKSWLNEESVTLDALSASRNDCALLLADLDVAQNTIKLLLRNHGAVSDCWFIKTSNFLRSHQMR